MPDRSFADKVAIVTGGGSGIGQAMCELLAQGGAKVVVADINSEDAERVSETIVRGGGQAESARVDVSKEEEVRRLVDHTSASLGRLDYMFNNAGIAIGGDVRDLTLDQWRRVLDVDLYGVLYGSLAAYRVMATQGFGHIVNTSSAMGCSRSQATHLTARASTQSSAYRSTCASRGLTWG